MKTPQQLIQKYRKKGVLIDTNLLLLYIVGKWDKQQIPKFKRTKKFTIDDYNLLDSVLGHFEIVITTPNILTEVSNLAGSLAESLQESCFVVFAKHINVMNECYVRSVSVIQQPEFVRFGLTDAGIMNMARNTYLVLTEDWPLHQYLQSKEVDVLNFNHLRLGLLLS